MDLMGPSKRNDMGVLTNLLISGGQNSVCFFPLLVTFDAGV